MVLASAMSRPQEGVAQAPSVVREVAGGAAPSAATGGAGKVTSRGAVLIRSAAVSNAADSTGMTFVGESGKGAASVSGGRGGEAAAPAKATTGRPPIKAAAASCWTDGSVDVPVVVGPVAASGTTPLSAASSATAGLVAVCNTPRLTSKEGEISVRTGSGVAVTPMGLPLTSSPSWPIRIKAPLDVAPGRMVTAWFNDITGGDAATDAADGGGFFSSGLPGVTRAPSLLPF